MTIHLSAILFLLALVLACVAAWLAPTNPIGSRLGWFAVAAASAGLFCSSTGLGN